MLLFSSDTAHDARATPKQQQSTHIDVVAKILPVASTVCIINICLSYCYFKFLAGMVEILDAQSRQSTNSAPGSDSSPPVTSEAHGSPGSLCLHQKHFLFFLFYLFICLFCFNFFVRLFEEARVYPCCFVFRPSAELFGRPAVSQLVALRYCYLLFLLVNLLLFLLIALLLFLPIALLLFLGSYLSLQSESTVSICLVFLLDTGLLSLMNLAFVRRNH